MGIHRYNNRSNKEHKENDYMQKENRVNVVILGGNGYVVTTIIEQWSKQDKNA